MSVECPLGIVQTSCRQSAVGVSIHLLLRDTITNVVKLACTGHDLCTDRHGGSVWGVRHMALGHECFRPGLRSGVSGIQVLLSAPSRSGSNGCHRVLPSHARVFTPRRSPDPGPPWPARASRLRSRKATASCHEKPQARRSHRVRPLRQHGPAPCTSRHSAGRRCQGESTPSGQLGGKRPDGASRGSW